MSKIYDSLQGCLEQIRRVTDFVPRLALVLGSGLGGFADEIDTVCTMSYKDIKGFPVSTVAGHDGRFIFGRLCGIDIVCMQGRVHYYEGYSMQETVMPIRLMRLLGAQQLMLTNAAGGISDGLSVGDLMLINDHISMFVPNPLIGENVSELGTRFPDMSEIYSSELREVIKKTAEANGIDLKEGVYAQLTGASYESPAEIRMLRGLGADAVGMSTACEAIAARHAGMQVCAVSCISNMAAGISQQPLTHDEVQETADRTAEIFTALIRESIRAIFAK